MNKYYVLGTELDLEDKQIPVPIYWSQCFGEGSNVVHYEGITEVLLGRLPGGETFQLNFEK